MPVVAFTFVLMPLAREGRRLVPVRKLRRVRAGTFAWNGRKIATGMSETCVSPRPKEGAEDPTWPTSHSDTTHWHCHPSHQRSSCQIIPCSPEALPASMFFLGGTLVAPWPWCTRQLHVHAHGTAPSFMSRIGSAPRYSEACPSPKAGACIVIASQHAHSLHRHVPTKSSYPPVAIRHSAMPRLFLLVAGVPARLE